MSIFTILGIGLIGGVVCGIISSVILFNVFHEDIQNILRYMESIRLEVDVALDELQERRSK